MAARKSKALPGAYENEGVADLAQAYDELTHSAYAVWIRLMILHPAKLYDGKRELCRILGYSSKRGHEVLRELERKGYVDFVSSKKRS